MEKREKEEKKQPVKSSYLFQLADNKQKSSLYIAVICSVISGFMAFVPYVMVYKTILFLFEGNEKIETAILYGMIAVAAIILRFVFQAASMALTHVGAYNLLYAVRKKLCRHIGKIELGYFTDNSTGEIKKVLMEDVERLENFFAHQIPDITVAICVPLTVLVYLLYLNVTMGLVLLIPILITFIIQFIEMAIAAPVMKDYSKIIGGVNSGIMQYVNGMSVMKAYNMTADSYESYSKSVADYNHLWKRLSKVLAPMSAVSKVVIESGIFFTLPVGGYLYLHEKLELGTYIFFIVMSIVFLSSYNNLLNFAQIFSQISSGLEEIKKLIDVPEMKSEDTVLDVTKSHAISFENVSFGYGEKEVLKNINLTMPCGSLTAFVGASGAGKTTAAQLIPRFWDVVKGHIRIDNTDIRKISANNLMDMVSFVFQETFMLNDTIYENIAIGKTDCTLEDVERAAKAAQIHDFILSLPNGYQTNIGEAGIKLSGGERQRICIARAILKNAPVIVFDEATSFTDAENEHKIQIALEELLKGKTTIMIAHRLHTIVGADQICVFEQGEIKEKGTHEELLLRHGLYEKMWNVYRNRGNFNA